MAMACTAACISLVALDLIYRRVDLHGNRSASLALPLNIFATQDLVTTLSSLFWVDSISVQSQPMVFIDIPRYLHIFLA